MTKDNKLPLFEIAAMIIGEIAVSLVLCGVYLIIKKFDTSILFGALLGSCVTVANFLFLVISTNRAVDKVMSELGDEELDEDAAAEFAKKHQGSLQATVKISYIVRTLSLCVALVLAFILRGVFDVIATVIPLLMFRPILSISQLIKKSKA